MIYKDKPCQKETKGRKVELTGNVRYCFRNTDYSFLWLLACVSLFQWAKSEAIAVLLEQTENCSVYWSI